MKDFALGEVGFKPWEFMECSWADWQRAAQGYLLRNARYLNGARKIAYFSLVAAGAKKVKERQLFGLITDDDLPEVPKINKDEWVTQEKVNQLLDIYFNNKKAKGWQQRKRV